MQGQVGAGVAGLGVVELLAEGGQRAGAAGRGRGLEPDVQGVAGDLQVAGQGERFPEQGSAFAFGGRSAGAAVGRARFRCCRR